jgi:hypothetical protein
MSAETVDRLAVLRADLQTIAAHFCAAVAALEPLAKDLADAEACLQAAEGQAGRHDYCPPARELAVEVLHGHLGALRPCLPFVSRDSAEQAEKRLRGLDG